MKIKDILNVVLSGLFIVVFSAICFFYETPAYSESERRDLAEMPEIKLESIVNGTFSKEFESYTTDRFPFRDFFRRVKAYSRYNLFLQKENNKIYFKDGHISKLDYVKNDEMLKYARDLFLKINETYLKYNKVYFAMVPDKNMYLADIKLDYNEIEEYFKKELPFENISIKHLLDKDDYYYTDSHWRQDKITDVAYELLDKMGVNMETTYKENTLNVPFKGVWLGQSALNAEPDTITYLTNDAIDNYNVWLLNNYGTGFNKSTTYNFEKAEGKDAYEFFLSGTQAVVVIRNPENTTGKRLVIFRDSFGSSISPLLAEGYSETILIDLRYINSSLLGNIKGISFENADVLFLYSTLLLNSSLGMK